MSAGNGSLPFPIGLSTLGVPNDGRAYVSTFASVQNCSNDVYLVLSSNDAITECYEATLTLSPGIWDKLSRIPLALSRGDWARRARKLNGLLIGVRLFFFLCPLRLINLLVMRNPKLQESDVKACNSLQKK